MSGAYRPNWRKNTKIVTKGREGEQESTLSILCIDAAKDVLCPLEKLPPYSRFFSSSCGWLQPSAAPVEPFGPNIGTLRAQPKMEKIHLEIFTEIHTAGFF